MSIIQPVLIIFTFECTRQELEDWGEKHQASRRWQEGRGEQHPGDWCRFCRESLPYARPAQMKHWRFAEKNFRSLDAGALQTARRRRKP